jgi:prolyl-tRNA synthetase
MSLPPAIAPFAVVITPVNYADAKQKEAADQLYRDCRDAGIDALLDDRDERPGVKFKDADLIGIPFRITIGKKLSEGKIEFVERRARASVDVPVSETLAHLEDKLNAATSAPNHAPPK